VPLHSPLKERLGNDIKNILDNKLQKDLGCEFEEQDSPGKLS